MVCSTVVVDDNQSVPHSVLRRIRKITKHIPTAVENFENILIGDDAPPSSWNSIHDLPGLAVETEARHARDAPGVVIHARPPPPQVGERDHDDEEDGNHADQALQHPGCRSLDRDLPVAHGFAAARRADRHGLGRQRREERGAEDDELRGDDQGLPQPDGLRDGEGAEPLVEPEEDGRLRGGAAWRCRRQGLEGLHELGVGPDHLQEAGRHDGEDRGQEGPGEVLRAGEAEDLELRRDVAAPGAPGHHGGNRGGDDGGVCERADDDHGGRAASDGRADQPALGLEAQGGGDRGVFGVPGTVAVVLAIA